MSEIQFPEEWAIASLESTISSDGLISDGDWVESKDQDPNGSIRLLQLADIGDGEFKDKSSRFMSPEKVKDLKCTKLKSGDLLISRMPEPIGRTCILPVLTQESVTVVDACIIRTGLNSAFNNVLLKHWMNSQKVRSFMLENASGTTRKRISRKKIEQLLLPLPPLAEQKQIADTLERLLAQIANSKAELEAALVCLKQFRQSVLTAAVSGELTEDWRKFHRIAISSWKNSTLGELSAVATGKTPSRKTVEYWDNGNVPWVTSSCTGDAFTVKAEQYVTAFAVKDCKLKLFKPGTLLMAMYGEGKTRGQVTELKISATSNQACAAIIVDETKANKNYIKIKLLENYEATRNAAAGGAQPNLNLNKVREINIPLPTLKEQSEITSRVKSLFSAADKAEAETQAALDKVNNLTQSILAKAFSGELTADWRAQTLRDNPELLTGENSAANLLVKIKAEREAKLLAEKEAKKAARAAAKKKT